MATLGDVLAVAKAAVQAAMADPSARSYRHADSRGDLRRINLDLIRPGVGGCSRFARQCHEVAAGVGFFTLPFFGGSARETQRKCARDGLKCYPNIEDAPPGSMLFFEGGRYGHVAILGDDGYLYENTSSTRGTPGRPGTKRTKVTAAIRSRVAAIYAAFETQAVTLEVIAEESASLVECQMIGDRLWAPVRSFANALGLEPDTSQWPKVEVRQ